MTSLELLPADYVLLGLMALPAVMGLFRGFSGTIAFFAAGISSVLAWSLVWHLSAGWSNEVWLRGLETFLVVLLVFGLVRIIVKKLVNGLLSQPSDALVGMLTVAVFGLLILVAWAYSGFHLEYSNLATEVAAYVR